MEAHPQVAPAVVAARQRSIRDSAWDYVLEQASTKKHGVVVYVEHESATDKERAYFGHLTAFGYEAADVKPWLYLTRVAVCDDEAHGWKPDAGATAGIFIHRVKSSGFGSRRHRSRHYHRSRQLDERSN